MFLLGRSYLFNRHLKMKDLIIMEENKFEIGWNTFEEHLRSTRKKLYDTKKFYNVTLVSDSMTPFKGHKSVLSSASKVFDTLIDLDEGSSCILYLRGIKDRELASLMEFIYLGQTFVSQERLSDFAKAANELNIEGLSNALNQKDCDESEEELDNVEGESHGKSLNTMDLKHEQLETEEYSEAEKDQNTLTPTKDPKFKQEEEDDNMNDQSVSYEISKVLPEGNILCTQCDKVLRDNHSFKRHFHAVHAKVKERCPECGKLYHRFSLKRHIDMKHKGIRYPCEYCAYIGTNKNAIKLHIKSSHNKELKANHEFTKYTTSKSN